VETLAIALYSLGGLVAAPVFCLCLVKIIRKAPLVATMLWYGSVSVLWLAACEVVLVAIVGSIGARKLLGPGFVVAHVLLVFTAAPALACALLLGRWHLARWWPVVAVVCWLVGVAAIFYQYNVMESLYGIDGVGGPYA
jgi:hypothetical protein